MRFKSSAHVVEDSPIVDFGRNCSEMSVKLAKTYSRVRKAVEERIPLRGGQAAPPADHCEPQG